MGVIEKNKYREWSKVHKLPLFAQGWWLDAMSDDWDVCLVERGGEIFAALPYVLRKKWQIIPIIGDAPWTKGSGPYFNYPIGQKHHTKLSFEKEMIEELIAQLPFFIKFQMTTPKVFTNWQPFFWKGFKQTTRYTYEIPDCSYPDTLFLQFDDHIRKAIRKASKDLSIQPSSQISEVYKVMKKTYSRKDQQITYSLDGLSKVYDILVKKEQGEMLEVRDAAGNLHAVGLYAWDKTHVYYLAGGINPKFKNSGAMSFLMFEVIKMAGKKGKAFDFEGSMNEGIAHFFKSFGAEQIPYFLIYKNKFF